MDYLVPTAMETPRWETDKTVTPSLHPPAVSTRESCRAGAHLRPSVTCNYNCVI